MDNPHTKPVAFWDYLISGWCGAKCPDVIFLSEAFTKPKMMKTLAKAGFTQSYTFSRRNSKQELTDYFTELTQTEMKEYFRGIFGRTHPIFASCRFRRADHRFRFVPCWPQHFQSLRHLQWFELCENELFRSRRISRSEKYQWKERDWNAPGNINIKPLIPTQSHPKRKPRLHFYDNLRFIRHRTMQFVYGKATVARDNIILIAVKLDPRSCKAASCMCRWRSLG